MLLAAADAADGLGELVDDALDAVHERGLRVLEPLRVRLPGGSLPERTGVTQNLLF